MVAEGSQNVAVNAVIAVLAEDGEDPASLTLPTADVAPVAAAPVAPAKEPVAPVSAPMPVAAPVAAPVSGPVSPAVGSRTRIFASPLARRIAGDNGVDLAALTGTGPHGRIIRADVEEAVARGITAPVATGSAVIAEAGSRFVPHNAMRRVIAERLQYSKQTAPHFYLTVDCEIDTLLSARKSLNENAPEGVKISVNDMVIKAAAYALMTVPDVNGCYEEEGCRYYDQADVCMAVAVDGGLVTPVIHGANKLSLSEIAGKAVDLAGRARSGKLDPSEYSGGSFTISNLGMFGIREFAAVINPPQGAILAVGAGEQRPVVKQGALAVATVMSVTLSADHRIVDGALGARWMQAFKAAIENPVMMLL
jgi:pyruvate dehydrogenase E2 component (dihydrolipoamide acetyltransferase)